MDLRTEKTRRAIINAFIKLRSKKPTEKITIKELAENAQINKATFYLHYRDIYDLSVSLEREVVRDCLKGIQHPEDILHDTRRFIKDLEDSFVANEQLIKILFEGSRSSSFVCQVLPEEIRKSFFARVDEELSGYDAAPDKELFEEETYFKST